MPQHTDNITLFTDTEIRLIFELIVSTVKGLTLTDFFAANTSSLEHELALFRTQSETEIFKRLKKLMTGYNSSQNNNYLSYQFFTGVVRNRLKYLFEIKKLLQGKLPKTVNELIVPATTRFDLNSAIRNKPRQHIKTRELPKENKEKKLIIHFPDILSPDAVFLNEIVRDISFMYKCYVCVNQKIVPYDPSQKADLISTNAIKEILSEQNEAVEDDYIILDYAKLVILKSLENMPLIYMYPENMNETSLEILGEIKTLSYVASPNSGEIGFSHEFYPVFVENLDIFFDKHSLTSFGFSENASRLRDFSMRCGMLYRISFEHAIALEEISFACLFMGEMDFSMLPKLREVYFHDVVSIGHIKIDPSQAETTTFYFRYHKESITEIISKKIALLKGQGFKVEITDTKIAKDKQDQAENKEHLGDTIKKWLGMSSAYQSTPDRESQYEMSSWGRLLADKERLLLPEGLQESTVADNKMHDQTNSLFDRYHSIDSSSYREKILTEIIITENSLRFVPYFFDERTADPYPVRQIPFSEFNQQALRKKPKGSKMGVLSLSNLPEQWVPVKSDSLEDELVAIDQESVEEAKKRNLTLDIRYSEETQQYFAKLRNKRNATELVVINLYYEMHSTRSQIEHKTKIPELPVMLKQAIEIVAKNHKVLQKLIQPTTNLKEKRDEIIAFCKQFKPRKITEKKKKEIVDLLQRDRIDNPDIHELVTRLYYQAGTCDDRSKVAMALMILHGIDARVDQNDVHAFIEYLDGAKWSKYDLGGVFVKTQDIHSWNEVSKKKQTPLNDNKFDDTRTFLPLVPDVRHEQKLSPLEAAEVEFASYFDPAELTLDESRGFSGWYQNLLTVPGHPLLTFNNKQDAWILHSLIMQQPGISLGENYLYIHDLSSLEEFLTQIQVKEDDGCYEVEGPLLRLFKNHQSLKLILMNISNLPVESCKSILDPHPIINGFHVPADLKVITICKSQVETCSSFNTRVKYVAWPAHPETLKDVRKASQASSSVEAKETVDLYHDPDGWEEMLVGKKRIEKNGFTWRQGVLTHSPATDVTLVAAPLEDPAFVSFYERVSCEKGFYANAEWRQFLGNIKLLPRITKANLRKKIGIYYFNASQTEVFFLNHQNYHAFFERNHITPDNGVMHIEGFLSEMPSGSTLVLTDDFTEDELIKLEELFASSEIEIADPKKQQEFKQKQAASRKVIKIEQLPYLKGSKGNAAQLLVETPSSSTVIFTADVNAAERIVIKNERNLTEVIDISSITELSDLFENIKRIQNKKKSDQPVLGKKVLSYHHETFYLFEFLKKAGNTVILKDDISSELYHQLETLFEPRPYLMINGKMEFVSGKFILITSPKKSFPHLFDAVVTRYSHTFSWEVVPNYLMTQIKNLDIDSAKNITEKIKQFYEEAKNIEHNGKTTPPTLLVTEDEVLRIAKAMLRNKHMINPIEHDFLQNYTEDKAGYNRLTQLAIQYLSDTESKKTPPLSQEQSIHDILTYSCFVRLRGEPGTGKTHFIKYKLPKCATFWGEKKIIKWLTSNNNNSNKRKKYLVVDEASTKEPGYWDFLKGLSTGKIFYKGKCYLVDPEIQKVIFTDNPESYPGRQYHSFLQQVPNVNFKPYDDETLIRDIILPALGDQYHVNLRDTIAQGFIAAYRQAQLKLPYQPLCVRDINALLVHFSHPGLPQANNALSCAHLACIELFSGLFKDKDSQQNYNEELNKIFGCGSTPLCPLPDLPDKSYVLPDSWQLLWHNVNQCIARGGKFLEGARRALLVEGPSGTGKSEMMIQALKQQGYLSHANYDPNNPNHTKIYFHIAMGSSNATQMILAAGELSKKTSVTLVVDELNLLNDEQGNLLNALLEGREPEIEKEEEEMEEEEKAFNLASEEDVYEEVEKKENPYELIVLASQNSQAERKRKVVPSPLLSRFDRFYASPLTQQDLLDVCAKSGKFSPDGADLRAQACVSVFWRKQKAFPKQINPRKFFEVVFKVLKKLSLAVSDCSSPAFFQEYPVVVVEEKKGIPCEIELEVPPKKESQLIPIPENDCSRVDERNAVADFFTKHPASSCNSRWKNRDLPTVTLEEIILHAMKDPTDMNGKDGNRTAQILYDHYDILVEQDISSIASYENMHEKCFKAAWLKIRQKEAPILKLFDDMRNKKIKEERDHSCCFFKMRSHIKNAKPSHLPQVLIKPSLVHLIEASNPRYISRILGKCGIYAFYSGNRTYSVLKKMDLDTRSGKDSLTLYNEISTKPS